jgi:hypothetical protein
MPNYYKVVSIYYTSNDSGFYKNVFLRHQNSFEEIEKFIQTIEYIAKDVKIYNGIDSINLINVYTKYGYSANDYRRFNFSSETSNFLIALSSNDGVPRFYHKFDGGYNNFEHNDQNGLWHLSLDHRNIGIGLTEGIGLLRNKFIESKSFMLRHNQLRKLAEEASVNESQYFDFVFGNYTKYYLTFQNFYYFGFIERTIPIQLTLIGDDTKKVFKIVCLNTITTDEISKISKFTIVK